MIKALKKAQTIYFCIVSINWIRFFRLYDRKAQNILWYYPGFRKKLFMQSVERDFGFIAGFIALNQPFRIYFGRNVGKFHNKTIFYSVTKYYELFGFSNYTHILYHISKQLETQGNKVYPASQETLYWENKAYMHEKFNELNIPHPKTIILKSVEDAEKANVKFPCLLKETHSSSSMGLHKINSKEELLGTIDSKKLFFTNESLLLQELLNIRRDMRITCVGNEICHHYWRINLSDEWKPTATGYGSRVDFVSFPEHWRSRVIEISKSLQLVSAGYDFAWQNDDLNSEPIVLEVSPFYQPNPPADMTGKKFTYGEYKKKFLLKDSWDKRFVDIIYELQTKIVKNVIESR
ncbi:MAG: ATP-grasp domain-containing protein [Bacteroidota bacterium]